MLASNAVWQTQSKQQWSLDSGQNLVVRIQVIHQIRFQQSNRYSDGLPAGVRSHQAWLIHARRGTVGAKRSFRFPVAVVGQ